MGDWNFDLAKELYAYARYALGEEVNISEKEFVVGCREILYPSEIVVHQVGDHRYVPREKCVVLDLENQCIDIPDEGYWIPLDEVKCRADIIEWIHHLLGKVWVDDDIIEDFIGVSSKHIGVSVYPNKNLDKESAKRERGAISPKLRYEVMLRDKFRCQLCGRGQSDGVKLHIDHIHPVSLRGESNMENLRTLCDECNFGKSKKIESVNMKTPDASS